MADVITTALFKLQADSSSLRGELNKADQSLNKVDGKAKQTNATFAQMGQGLRNLANKAGLGGLVSSFDSVTKTANSGADAIGGMTKNLGKGTKMAKVFGATLKVALGAVGILIGALAVLGGAFLSTQRGQNALRRATNFLKVGFDVAKGALQDYATELKDVFDSNGIMGAGSKIANTLFNTIKNNGVLAVSAFQEGVGAANMKLLELRKTMGLISDEAFEEAVVQNLNFINDAGLRAAEASEDTNQAYEKILKNAEEISELEEEIELLYIKQRKELAEIDKERIKSRAIENDTRLSLEERLKASQEVIL